MATSAVVKKSELALIKTDTVDIVAEKVRQFQERGEIHFPANYSPENAMKSAWLTLQDVVDKDKKPALEVCTKNSIANALLNMVVQGLNPAKKQGYFIVYGKDLVFQRSYFGTMAVCKQVTGATEIYAQVVYGGDDFEYGIQGSKKVITKHVQKLENVRNDNIVAAYCTVEWEDGRQITDIMTFEQIKQAWKQSKMFPVDAKGNIKPDSTHGKFTADMTIKTIINRTCKPLINASDDGSLLIKHVKASDSIIVEAEVAGEIAESANVGPVIDIDTETGEVLSDEEDLQAALDAEIAATDAKEAKKATVPF